MQVNRILLIIFFLSIALGLYSEGLDANLVEANRFPSVNTMYEEQIKNVRYLEPFFQKLLRLEKQKEGKVNIVHIGDSHIQADFFTNAIRQPLQHEFGNGGYGFTFPYNLARGSNGTKFFRFTSNVAWQNCRNNQPTRCPANTEFGLCGYGFTSQSKQFVIAMNVNERYYNFNTIKVVSPNDPSCFRLATAEGNPVIQSVQSSVKYHKIKSGESLSVIASKYNVSVATLKKENNLKSDNIFAGKSLRIPVVTTETKVNMSLFQPLEYTHQEQYVATYHQAALMDKIYLLPAENQPVYNLNGIVLENDRPGLIYHSVGTVGSKASDFNATPLFFRQLPVLTPDLVIISFGTNESYGKVPVADFMAQMQTMIDNVRSACPDVPILVMTPPTSLLRRGALNTLASDYSGHLMQKDDVALWDLYSYTGGITGAKQPLSILIASDNVHYTAQGYTNQGTAFANDLLCEYDHFRLTQNTDTVKSAEVVPLDIFGNEVREAITE